MLTVSSNRTAESTPDTRDRVIDLMRVTALSCVVIGHWLMQGVYVDDAGPHRQGLLGLASWTHSLTWVLQVMPIIFLVGGYANAVSWRRARSTGASYGGWLYWRARRLTRPLLPLLLLWSVVAVIAVYLLVVAVVPITLYIWDRFGLVSIMGGLVLSAAVDLVSLATSNWLIGAANLLLVWGTMHQVGYAWLDGSLRAGRIRYGLAAASFVVLVALVWVGPYAISMVGVNGFGVDNTNPPRVTILLLGLWQAGVALLMERRLRALAERRMVWQVIVAVESRMMTIYLWHLTALGLLLGASMQTGIGLRALPNTAAWWSAMPPWLLALFVTTALITWAMSPYELPPTSRPVVPASVSLTEAATIGALVALLAHYGLILPDGRILWFLPLAAALLLIAVARTSAHRSN